MASTPVSTRIPDWIAKDVRRFWRARGERPSPGYRRVLEEWWVHENLPLLEFRDGPAGRRPGIRNGPDVWEIVMVARDVDGELAALREHFGGHVSDDALRQALEYEQRFPDVIAARLEENERVARMLMESR